MTTAVPTLEYHEHAVGPLTTQPAFVISINYKSTQQ